MEMTASTKEPFEVISAVMKQRGLTAKWLASEIDISETSIGKILRGDSPRSGFIPDIANALRIPMSAVYSEDMTAILSVAHSHTLDDATECLTPYFLQLDDEIDFLPTASSVLISPPTDEAKRQSKFWLFRYHNERRSAICKSVRVGDKFLLVSAQEARSDRQSDPDLDGSTLGVIQDIASCERMFRRT